MILELPDDVLEELPAADENGLVRVGFALRRGEGNSVTVAEINDVPVALEEEDEPLEETEELADPTPEEAAAAFAM